MCVYMSYSPSCDEEEGVGQRRKQRDDEIVDELACASHRLAVQVDAVGPHPETVRVELAIERNGSLYTKPSRYIKIYICAYIYVSMYKYIIYGIYVYLSSG